MKKVYGPYTRKDGRKHVIHDEDGVRRTQSYPRYLMEEYLERALLPEETVDHINEDFTDDRLENLQLLSGVENKKKSAPGEEILFFICPVCSIKFQKSAAVYRHNQIVQGKAGPYCSKSCSGKIHH